MDVPLERLGHGEEWEWTQHIVEFEKVVGSERANNAHCRQQTQ